MPEIGLTPQTLGRVAARLGDRVAVHPLGPLARGSASTSGAGCAPARRASASGRARPSSRRLSDLGLIVVDEEHDSSYKQEGDPRYDARAVARRRAAEAGAVYLAGSATPRPESWA